jgi:hypothetical protein
MSVTNARTALVLGAALAALSFVPASAHQHHYRHHGHVAAVPAPGVAAGVDTVGSIVYDGHGFGYNRITGERYAKCMFDEGYGRVLPCDAGGTR